MQRASDHPTVQSSDPPFRDAPAAVARDTGGHQAAVPAAVVRDEISCDDLSVQPNLSCMISYDIQFLKNLFREIKLTVWVQTFRLFWIWIVKANHIPYQ